MDPESYFKVGQVLHISRTSTVHSCIPSIKLIVLMLVNLPDQVFGLQIVEAKVHQLDFSLERIFLSLKEITVIFIHFLGRYGVDQGILYRN